MERPEHVKCIASPMKSLTTTLCGEPLEGRWGFTGLDHVFANAIQQGRMVPCAACVDAGVEILNAAKEPR